MCSDARLLLLADMMHLLTDRKLPRDEKESSSKALSLTALQSHNLSSGKV